MDGKQNLQVPSPNKFLPQSLVPNIECQYNLELKKSHLLSDDEDLFVETNRLVPRKRIGLHLNDRPHDNH